MDAVVGDRFEIIREAGEGGMARVYRALDRVTGTDVALKILHGASDAELRRFAREVSALSELSHPAVVSYVAHGRTPSGRPYLAMEWLEGEDLEKHLARVPVSIDDTIELTRIIADALAEAHRRGIVHRDVKPSNIFLVSSRMSTPKLLDFGIARDEHATAGLTMMGNVLGTPAYMAPEQARGELDLDARVDVFALGGVLFACLARRPPFVASNVIALLAKIVLDEAPRVSTFRPDVPRPLERLVARMLAKVRDDRPFDAGAVLQELASLATVAPGSEGSVSHEARPLAVGAEQRVVCILLGQATVGSADVGAATVEIKGVAMQRLADGSFLATFSGPESPADLAARAVRFALAMRSKEMALSVATGRASLAAGVPVGDVIDRAARELVRAGDAVRVDATTSGLLEGRFELLVDAHGATVVDERRDRVDAVRTLLGKPTRCVGRDREISAIEGYYAQCVEESFSRAVLVTAPAGTGKSRVAREVIQRLSDRPEPPEVLFARAESVSSGSPFAMIGSALQRAARIDSADAPDVRRSKLRARLERSGISTDAIDFLAEALGIASVGLESDAMRAARASPALMFERIRAAFEDFVRRESELRPIVLVMEDLQWGDVPSVKLVEAALRALEGRPFLVLALARPEVRTVFPDLWRAHAPHELRLDPLPRRASERLIKEALGASATDDTVERIVARANGNAFFLEELIRAAASGDIASLPDAVVGVVQLRFDVLRSDTRVVLHAASVFGERFSRRGVEALVGDTIDVPAALAELVEREIVASNESVDGQAARLQFRHALFREAAYVLLTDVDRKRAHGLAGAHLAHWGGAEPLELGEHFEQGGDLPRAAEWFGRGAEQALEGNDLTSATALARRAQSLLTEGASIGMLELLVAEAAMWRTEFDAAMVAAERGASLIDRGSAAWFQAAGLAVSAAGQRGENDPVVAWIERAMATEPDDDALSAFVVCLARGSSQLLWTDRNDYIEVARRALAHVKAVVSDRPLSPHAEGRLLFAQGYEELYVGRVSACLRLMGMSAECYMQAGAARDAVQSSMVGAMLYGFVGKYELSIDGLERCLASAAELGSDHLVEWTRFEMAMVQILGGQRELGRRNLDAVSPAVRARPLFSGGGICALAAAAVLADDLDELARQISEIPAQLPERYQFTANAMRAYLHCKRGHRDEARTLALKAIEGLASVHGRPNDLFILGYMPALMTLCEIDVEAARPLLVAHRARLHALADLLDDDDMRASFLGMGANARCLELYDQYVGSAP